MPTLSQIRNRCDNFLSNLLNIIVSVQGSYYAANGRYWQGLLTHSVIPSHTTFVTNDTSPDLLSRRPTDQALNWVDVLPSMGGVVAPVALAVDVYEDDGGHGYVIHLLVKHNDITYGRSYGTGHRAEAYTRPWGIVNIESNM